MKESIESPEVTLEEFAENGANRNNKISLPIIKNIEYMEKMAKDRFWGDGEITPELGLSRVGRGIYHEQ